MDHPADDILRRFHLGTTSRQENRQIVRHLLAHCPACAAALHRMRPQPVAPRDYAEALDRSAANLGDLCHTRPLRQAPANLLTFL